MEWRPRPGKEFANVSRAEKYRVTYSWPKFFLAIVPEKNRPLCPAGHFCTKLGPQIKLVNMAHVSLLPGGAILRGAMQAAGPVYRDCTGEPRERDRQT